MIIIKLYFNQKIYLKIENNHGMTPPVVYNYTQDWIYSEKAPWTTEAANENNPAKKKVHPIVAPLKDWFWFRGDFVRNKKFLT